MSTAMSTLAGVVPEVALNFSHGLSFWRRILQASEGLPAAVTSTRCAVAEFCARLSRSAGGDNVTDVTTLGGSMMKVTGIRTSAAPSAWTTMTPE